MILLFWEFFWFSAKKVKKTGLVQNKQIRKFRPKAEKKVLDVVFCMVFVFSVSFYKEKTLKLQFGTEVSFLVPTQTKFGIIFGLENKYALG